MQQTKSIGIEKLTPPDDPKYITPVRIHYTQEGVAKSWEAIRSYDSVAVLLYHRQKDAFLLVKQLRVATLLSGKEEDGYTIELCAGIVDKELPLEQIAKEEILEECGYDVPLESIERVTAYYTSVGFSGAKQTMYYATIDDSMYVNEGGGIENEKIELFYLPSSKAKHFIFDERYKKTPGLIVALYWFFQQRYGSFKRER